MEKQRGSEKVNPDEHRAIGRNIRDLRRAHGLAQRDIAKLLSISVQQVQKYESGQNRLTVDKLFRLQQFYNVPYEVFFTNIRSRTSRLDSPFFNAYQKFLTLKDLAYRKKVEDVLLVLLR